MEARNQIVSEAYVQHYDVLFKTAYGMLKDVHDAEDAVQESFALALKYYHSFNPEKAGIGAWINRIMRNVCYDIKRAKLNKGVSVEFDEELCEGVYMTHDGEQLLEKMAEHIKKEPAGDNQSILYLYYIDGARPIDIALIVGCTQVKVRQVVFIFRNKLKKLYEGVLKGGSK